MSQDARYDEVADWYEREFVASEVYEQNRTIVLRLLGRGPGCLIDVGCGGGANAAVYTDRGWSVVGVDTSEEQLRFARSRGVDVTRADAAALPFADASFDAAVSTWLHTDVDDFPAVLREIGRVLRPGGPFVYAGAHPCFVGPHSRFVAAEGLPVLHPGYWRTEHYTEAPGISPAGLRAKVGATHLPLGQFVQAFLDAGLRLEHFEEPKRGEYPYMVALRCRR
jgi:SAM-dependent methyltransferase